MVSRLFRYNKWLAQTGCAWATHPMPVYYTWALTVRLTKKPIVCFPFW